jgi:DMSO reductase anchor subunit
MVYVDTQRPCWSAAITCPNFFGTAGLLGVALAAAVLGFGPASPEIHRGLITLALLLAAGLTVWREARLRLDLAHPDRPRHWNARAERERLPRILWWRRLLFGMAAVCWIVALQPGLPAAPVWTVGAMLAVLAGETLARYTFFAAGAGRRMPGGVTP